MDRCLFQSGDGHRQLEGKDGEFHQVDVKVFWIIWLELEPFAGGWLSQPRSSKQMIQYARMGLNTPKPR